MSVQRRYDNFFRGTHREPDLAYESLEAQALIVVRESILAHAQSIHRDLSAADLDRMLAAAQSQLRGLPPEDLRGISPSSALLRTITEYSFSAAPVTNLRSQAELAAAAARDQTIGAEGSETLAARLSRMAIERAERSGNRFDALASERLSQSDLQNVAAARALANELGMPWAASNSELLRLGPGAIRTLHDAGVQRERFERITGERVGFRAATAVDIAAFARRRGLTPDQTNRLYDRISDGVEVISGGNRQVQRELDEATRRYVTGPDTPEAREALERAYGRYAVTPEKREAARATTRALTGAGQRNDADLSRTDAAERRIAARADDLDASLGLATGTPGADRVPPSSNAAQVTPTSGAAVQPKAPTPRT